MDARAYLTFNGKGAAALAAYTRIFNTQPTSLMRMSQAAPEMTIPDARANWIMHCELPIGNSAIYLSDDIAGSAPAMAGSAVMVNCKTAAEAQGVFDALAQDGEVITPWDSTSQPAGFGVLTDRFGIRWMVGCDAPP